MKLSELANRIGARLEPADADVEIFGIATIETAIPGQVTFVSNPKYAPLARTTQASAIIVDEHFPSTEKPLLRTKNPQHGYARAVTLFHTPVQYKPGIHPTAVVDPSAKIGDGASIGPYVTIEADVEIGQGCTLLPHVVIYRGVKIGNNVFAHAHVSIREYCEIGNNVLLHNGVVVGSDGFGFAKDDNGRWQKIPQTGKVVIEDDVEIQANSCIDRASLGESRIGRGTKIDNLVQVGHNCTVGENSMLCAQVGMAGSTELGRNVILAGQVGIAGHCKLGDGVIVTAQSGTSHDIEPGRMISGSPAFDNKQWLRSVAIFNKLPELAKALRMASNPPRKKPEAGSQKLEARTQHEPE
ncbi:MAG TPA: UDP-3-O-(3-hydroxymyristoyl)glucosamine N-acyltransferase [Candidatus Angelobacter sp.]|jgi:UDP-3-O-[3-hydroxymyristoyl] glucosamine N-acyltransferase|nr:UDP-3-O-(3-hydroxymyristoyl)glucosamine N-acyltransferase [Candidatus Angelobacter sp.]